MKTIIRSFVASLLITAIALAGGFNVKATGNQTFSFKDKMGRNQATFFSTTPLEDISGMSSDVMGSVTFDVQDIENTLEGEIIISTASLKSGIDLRDEHIRGADWLDAEQFPEITFKITGVENLNEVKENMLTARVIGEFTCHDITKEVYSDVTLTYLDENEMTKMKMPGDLLGARAEFNIKLSDFGVQHMALGKKVADNIEIKVNIVGSNKM